MSLLVRLSKLKLSATEFGVCVFMCVCWVLTNGPYDIGGDKQSGRDLRGNDDGHVRFNARLGYIKRAMHGPGRASGWPSMRQVARLRCSAPGWRSV